MLGGKGKGNENGEKTTIGLISKKASLHVQHTFFVHFFVLPLFCTTTKWNFQKFPSYTFMEELSYVFLFTFFLFTRLPLIFTFVAASISHFLTAANNFSRCSSNKKCFLCYYLSLLLSVALFLVELRWPIAYFLFFSVFLFFYIPNLWAWQLI